MTSRWRSIDEMAREYGFTGSAESGALRMELRKIVSELHPDKNGGQFRSEENKKKYFDAVEAIEYLDVWERSSQALIPVSQLPAIIAAISDAIGPRLTTDSVSLHSSATADARVRLSRIYVAPKIGSGAFAAVSAFLFSFADKLSANPVLAPFFNNNIGHLVLLLLAAYSGIFFVMVWIRERQAETRSEFIMSEYALNRIFPAIREIALTSNPPNRISFEQIQEVVQTVGGVRPGPMRVMSYGRLLDLPTIEKATEVQTQRLVERKVLTKMDTRSFQTWYEFHQ